MQSEKSSMQLLRKGVWDWSFHVNSISILLEIINMYYFFKWKFLRYSSSSDPHEYSTFLKSRPDIMELEAIRTVTQLCLQYQYVMMRTFRMKFSTFKYLIAASAQYG